MLTWRQMKDKIDQIPDNKLDQQIVFYNRDSKYGSRPDNDIEIRMSNTEKFDSYYDPEDFNGVRPPAMLFIYHNQED